MYSIIYLNLRERSKNILHTLSFIRSMGGGPRTFPGGLNKWQWKRLHEKKAKEKEKKLLAQEKQLYQARIRSQIRANLADEPKQQNYSPITPQDHIKNLADRFMTQGAEDLWNEADGPIKSPTTPHPHNTNIDLRNLISAHRNFSNCSHPRHYSVATHTRTRSTRFKFGREESSSSDDDEDSAVRLSDDEEIRGRGNKRMQSSAALGKYDVKIKKRVPLKFLQEEDDLSQHIEVIRSEFNNRNLAENIGEKTDEE